MLPLSARGLVRFDVEDYLTAESDEALARMLDAMHRCSIPGSYGLVGKKVEALKARGRTDILDALAREKAIGFHSLSHSEHPTVAEELAELPYSQALTRFVDRERPGVDAVADLVRAPRYFTQPGGNWIPEAAEGLPSLGMDIYFTDSFNSYVVDLPEPYWYGEVLLYSFPVINPRPFGLGLPGNLSSAISLIEAQQDRDGAFMVMLHPTELVTYEFWDAVNFPRGTTRPQLVPAPVRTEAEQRAALESFENYLQEIGRFDIEWYDSESLREKTNSRRPVTVGALELTAAVRTQGWGPIGVRDGHLSAAESLYALAKLHQTGGDASIAVGYVKPPATWEPAQGEIESLSRDRLALAAGSVVHAVEATGRLPSSPLLGDVSLEQVLMGLMNSRESIPPRFLSYIKEPRELHWDWPIFPLDFRPMRLWQDARRLAWTLKPAEGTGSRMEGERRS